MAADRMFGVDKGGYSAFFLSLGDGMEGKSSLTRRFGAENLDYTPFWETSHTKGVVQTDGAGRNHVDFLHSLVAKLHDGAAAIVFLNVAESLLQSLRFSFAGIVFGEGLGYNFFCHICILLFCYCGVIACCATKLTPDW